MKSDHHDPPPSFQDQSLQSWIDALRRNQPAPDGLFEAFPRSIELIAAGLRHASAEVRARVAFLLLDFESRFDHRIFFEADESGMSRAWSIDRKRYRVFAKAARELAPLLGEMLSDPSPNVQQLSLGVLCRFGEAAAPALAALEKAISDSSLAEEAIRTLGYIGAEANRAGEKILEVLQDDTRPVKEQAVAADAIARLRPKDPRVISALVKAAESDRAELRRSAVGSLWYTAPKDYSVVTKIAAVAGSGDADLHKACLMTLARIDRVGRTVIPLLLQAAKDPDAEARLLAVIGLGEHRDKPREVITSLFEALEDDDARVRARATAEMGFLANEVSKFPDDLLSREALDQRLRKNVDDPDAGVQKAAAMAIANWGPTKAMDLPRLRELALHGPSGARWDAIVGLLCSGPPDAETRRVFREAMKDPGERTRLMAATGLAQSEELDDESVAALVSALRDKDPWLQLTAAERLLRIVTHAGEADSVLRSLLSHESETFRSRAAGLLLQKHPQDESFISPLPQGLKAEEAAWALALLGSKDPASLPVLAARFEEGDVHVRRAVAMALSCLGAAAIPIAPTVAKALRDLDAEVRENAIICVGRMGAQAPPDLRASLDALRHDKSARVRALAEKALRIRWG